jgi:hypothetical protein
LPESARETLEKAALLGAEFSVPVLLSAGGAPGGLDRLFDDGWLAETGGNRARFLQPAQLQEIVAAIPWSRKRKWHSVYLCAAVISTRAFKSLGRPQARS